MQLRQQTTGGVAWVTLKNNAGNGILDTLKFGKVRFGNAEKEGVGIVKARLDEGDSHCPGHVISKGLSDVT